MWSYSPLPARRIGKFAWGQELGDTDCAGIEEAKGKARETESGTDRETHTVRQGERHPGQKTKSERASNLEPEKTQDSKFRRPKERRASCRQKRAEAETEASARGDAGTRRERFGSVTVLPHLENITSPLKKNKYKKGLDIKRRQILLSLEGVGRRWPG